MVKHIPNFLTLFRVVLIPVFVVLVYLPHEWAMNLAILIFIVAAVTDYFDGYLARRFNVVSDFGKLLDPVADKILVMAALVVLVGLRSTPFGLPWVPAWMVVMVLAREIWVTGLRAVAANMGVVVPAAKSGKIKSALQMFAIIILLLHDNIRIPYGELYLTGQFIGELLLGASIIFSYQSAVDYSTRILSLGTESR